LEHFDPAEIVNLSKLTWTSRALANPGALSSEVIAELLRNQLPEELLFLSKTGSSADAGTAFGWLP
jgi:hypothetical protein